MLGYTKTSDTRQTVQAVCLPLTQHSFKVSAGQGGSRQFVPSGHLSPGPTQG